MSDGISILKTVKEGGYEASLITTFNAFMPFYEGVVLRHFMSKGVRHNVLMMDSGQLSKTVDRSPPILAGKHYTLVPMKASGAFHPKLIFLFGKNKGKLFVGSHNLTISGFGYNREMTNLVHVSNAEDSQEISVIQTAWKRVLEWVNTQEVSLPGHVIEMVRKVTEFSPWFNKSLDINADNCWPIGSDNQGQSLLEQLRQHVPDNPVHRVIVSGAFFDTQLKFIKELKRALKPTELIVGIDPSTVQCPPIKHLEGVTFVNSAKLGGAGKTDKETGYLHAKALVIQTSSGETLLAVGSANPSSPAWLNPDKSKNVEMMLVRKGLEAETSAHNLGLLDLPSAEQLTEFDWDSIRLSWENREDSEQSTAASQICMALTFEGGITFEILSPELPTTLACDVVDYNNDSITVEASLSENRYVIYLDEKARKKTCFIKFSVHDKHFTAIVQHVQQIDGLSRTPTQRKLNESIAAITTDIPDIGHFVDCISNILDATEKIAIESSTKGSKDKGKGGNKVRRLSREGLFQQALRTIVRQNQSQGSPIQTTWVLSLMYFYTIFETKILMRQIYL